MYAIITYIIVILSKNENKCKNFFYLQMHIFPWQSYLSVINGLDKKDEPTQFGFEIERTI